MPVTELPEIQAAGEPDALKGASPVREGAVGKGPLRWVSCREAPRWPPTSLRPLGEANMSAEAENVQEEGTRRRFPRTGDP